MTSDDRIGSDRLVSDLHSNLSDPIRSDPNVTKLLFGSDRIRIKVFGSDESDNPIRSVYISRRSQQEEQQRLR